MACSALQAESAYTKLGTWAPTEADAELIELMADKDQEWEASLKGKSEWLNRPAQPPGLLRSGAASCRAPDPLSGALSLQTLPVGPSCDRLADFMLGHASGATVVDQEPCAGLLA